VLTKLTETVTLKRDCTGIAIPAGTPVTLPAGSQVVIKQALGGDFTVRTDCGDLVRIIREDADALGKPVTESPAPVEGPLNEEMVWQQLRTIFDPELPASIVDLGLVYECRVKSLPEGGQGVGIKMTLTAPGCGMGDVLKQDVERKVSSLPGVEKVNVDIVFDPPWSPARMSDAARLELGLF
jgi:probable FeS assembly SUF system protein SufT